MATQNTQAGQVEYEDLLKKGLQCGKTRQYAQAAAHFSHATRVRPNSPDAYFNLGVANRELGRLEAAIDAFTHAVALKPDWPEAQFNLGNAFRDGRQPARAIECFEKAVGLRPNYSKALNNLANQYLEQGQLAKAEKTLRNALIDNPDYAEGLFNLGRTLRRLRRNAEALEVVQKAAMLRPMVTRYQHKLAEFQRVAGQLPAARLTLEKLLKESPQDLQTIIQFATLLKEQGENKGALEALSRAGSAGTANVEFLVLRAEILRLLKRYDEALADANSAIARDPQSAEAFNLLCIIWFAKGEPALAVEAGKNAILLRPDFAEALNNLGAAFQAIRRYTEGQESFESAIRLRPSFAIARLNRALCLMRDGNYQEGWREFEWRFVTPEYRMHALGKPTWMGESLVGKTILLRGEQGLGDTLQFVRFAKLVKDRGARVVVECQEPVIELVKRVIGVDAVVKKGAALPYVDVQIPIMSLPLALGLTVDSIPSSIPYLCADPDRIIAWRQRLEVQGVFRVGINWQGNKKFQADHLRSMDLKYFAALAKVDGVELVSLQKNEGAEQLNQDLGFKVHEFTSDLDADGAFRDTAAIIKVCDLVVTSDTAIAHLAGGLGQNVWTAIPHSPDWRWLQHGCATPWYPQMRLFRQDIFKDWDSVFSKMASELRRVVEGERDRLITSGNDTDGVHVEVSSGELIDKITILEIKEQHISDAVKLMHVRQELQSLRSVCKRVAGQSEQLRLFSAELKCINEELWKIEDEIRLCELSQDFGDRFVQLARSVYVTNDKRATIKRRINELLNSRITEVKSYVGDR